MKSENNEKEKHIVLDKFLTARVEARKKISSRIKKDYKNKYEYNLLIKDKIASNTLKDVSKLRDIRKDISSLSINLNINKELKEENEDFLKGFKSVKDYKKEFVKNYDENYEDFQKFEDIIIQYKNKGYIKIPKLNMDKNNLFKVEPILLNKSKIEDIIEALNKNPKSEKNIIFLNNTKKYLNLIKRNRRMSNNTNLKHNTNINNINDNNNNQETNNSDYYNSSSMRDTIDNNFKKNLKNNILTERINSMSHLTLTTSNHSQEKNDNKNKSIKYKLRQKEIDRVNSNLFQKLNKEKKNKNLINSLSPIKKSFRDSIFSNEINFKKESNKELIKEIKKLFEYLNEIECEKEKNKKSIKQIFTKIPIVESNRRQSDILFKKKKNKQILKTKPEHKFSINLNNNNFSPLSTKNSTKNYFKFNFSPLQNESVSNKNSRNNLNILNRHNYMKKSSVENINNEETELKSQFDSFKNKEEFFNCIYNLVNNKNYNKFIFMMKLYLRRFKNYSQKKINHILNIDINDPSLILNNIKSLNNKIYERDISEKIKTIYLRNNKFENILDKFGRLSKNEKSLSHMDKNLAKTLSLLYE